MARTREAHPYRRTQILTASPGELMLLLYNAAITCAEQARATMGRGQFDEAHVMLVKAENCVMELSSGLRREVHPELVGNLSRLFEFVFYKLFEGNVSHNTQCVDDAVNVLNVLRDAWTEALARVGGGEKGTPGMGESGSVELSA
ncbi:MAG TPA: flagellar export chaperone FliS [Planctomycetota bacterium]|nr:flagellar export chaperone FliS [Planctomycetota bacterium]